MIVGVDDDSAEEVDPHRRHLPGGSGGKWGPWWTSSSVGRGWRSPPHAAPAIPSARDQVHVSSVISGRIFGGHWRTSPWTGWRELRRRGGLGAGGAGRHPGGIILDLRQNPGGGLPWMSPSTWRISSWTEGERPGRREGARPRSGRPGERRRGRHRPPPGCGGDVPHRDPGGPLHRALRRRSWPVPCRITTGPWSWESGPSGGRGWCRPLLALPAGRRIRPHHPVSAQQNRNPKAVTPSPTGQDRGGSREGGRGGAGHSRRPEEGRRTNPRSAGGGGGEEGAVHPRWDGGSQPGPGPGRDTPP